MSKLFIERVVSMSWLPLMLSFVHTRTLISMLVSAVVRKTISFWRHWDIVVNAVAYLIKHLKCNTPADAIDYPRLLFPILWLMTCRFQLNSYPYTIFVFLSCFLSHFLASSFIISFSVCVSRSSVLPRSLPFDESAIENSQKPSPRAWSTNSLWSSTLSYESTDKCAKRFSSYPISLLFVYVPVFVSSINCMNQHIN